MNKKKNLNIDIDANINSMDDDITNQSIDNNIKNNFNTDGNARPAIRKTKTTKGGSPHKQKQTKKAKTTKKIKKSPNKNEKKVKFTEKIDIIKVECWKKYNLEQTADECEFIDDYFDDFESGTHNNNNSKTDNKNGNNNKNKSSNKNDNDKDKNKNNNDKNKRVKGNNNKQKKIIHVYVI